MRDNAAAAVSRPAGSEAARHDSAPVVIIGSGPVGLRAAQELLRRAPELPLVIYGNEPWQPYNRVKLSGLLAGELALGATYTPLNVPAQASVMQRYNCAVTAIDGDGRSVTDATGHRQSYRALILATGSRPHIPNIAGVDLPGIFTFRDMSDVEKLLARRVRSRRTVVLGGGLLGLEAARAMQRYHTEVYVIEHGTRLMGQQLDDEGGDRLREYVLGLGLRVILRDSVKAFTGTERIEGLLLRSGRSLECDTVVLATGIVPNVELARNAGLHIGRGIRVDDGMRTNDPYIYAIGECAEHRGHVYGLVGPGYEQAAVAAFAVNGGTAHYTGSIVAARLKVLGLPVFSVGRTGENEAPGGVQSAVFVGKRDDVYRKIVIERGRLVGALGVGECPELGRLQEAVTQARRVWPWQVARFRRRGVLWGEQHADEVRAWPAGSVVCNCTGVTRGTLADAIRGGCSNVTALMQCTGASTVCGSCRPLLNELVGSGAQPSPLPKPLVVSAVVALLLTLMMVLFPAIPYRDSVQTQLQVDVLWLSAFWKQVSGYTLLVLCIAAAALSLRKRWPGFKWGDFSYWQYFHGVVGAVLLIVLVIHTGMHLGVNLNQWLMLDFLALAALGAASGGLVAAQAQLPARLGKRLRDASVWVHTMAFWPLPVLLGFHIVSVYYF